MSAPERATEPAPTPGAGDCQHVIHEWPIIGPWVDYTCANCGQDWRLPLTAAVYG